MNYLELEPACAKRLKPEKLESLWGSAAYVAEEKLDGWRYLMHLGRDLPRVFLTGRRVSERTGLLSEKGEQVPQIWPSQRSGFGYTVLDGEICAPSGANFRDIAGLMNAEPSIAQETIRRIGPPVYKIFDVLFIDGEDVRDQTQLERRRLLGKLEGRLKNPLIQLVPQREPKRHFFDEVVARGGEGIMLKMLGDAYGDGWVKVKREHTLDVVVTGFTEARFGRTGRIFGQIGAICVSVYADGVLVEVAQVSGMDDATRADITDHKGEWLGRVIEITAQEWAKDRLRHPRYLRQRPDADARSCTFTKMMRDLGREDDTCRDDRQLQLL